MLPQGQSPFTMRAHFATVFFPANATDSAPLLKLDFTTVRIQMESMLFALS
jgi:hypothetical protein